MKKVAVIQDLSSFGKCSLTAAIPVLSVMGVQACPLPTAVLTAQTGYPSFFYEDMTSKMVHYIEQWSNQNEFFDGIYTGFVTGQEQINNIFQFLSKFHKEDTKLLVDPVMGDVGEVYKLYTEEMLERMKELVKCADVITPNVTECCLLTGMPYEKLQSYSNNKDFIAAIEEVGHILHQDTGGAKIIITGVNPPSLDNNEQLIGNMYIDGSETFYNLMPYNGRNYSGTGDLFASVIMGSLMRGDSLEQGIVLAQKFLTAAIHDASIEHVPEIEGVQFEKHLRMLL